MSVLYESSCFIHDFAHGYQINACMVKGQINDGHMITLSVCVHFLFN